jgi:hypothetical protein
MKAMDGIECWLKECFGSYRAGPEQERRGCASCSGVSECMSRAVAARAENPLGEWAASPSPEQDAEVWKIRALRAEAELERMQAAGADTPIGYLDQFSVDALRVAVGDQFQFPNMKTQLRAGPDPQQQITIPVYLRPAA